MDDVHKGEHHKNGAEMSLQIKKGYKKMKILIYLFLVTYVTLVTYVIFDHNGYKFIVTDQSENHSKPTSSEVTQKTDEQVRNVYGMPSDVLNGHFKSTKFTNDGNCTYLSEIIVVTSPGDPNSIFSGLDTSEGKCLIRRHLLKIGKESNDIFYEKDEKLRNISFNGQKCSFKNMQSDLQSANWVLKLECYTVLILQLKGSGVGKSFYFVNNHFILTSVGLKTLGIPYAMLYISNEKLDMLFSNTGRARTAVLITK